MTRVFAALLILSAVGCIGVRTETIHYIVAHPGQLAEAPRHVVVDGRANGRVSCPDGVADVDTIYRQYDVWTGRTRVVVETVDVSGDCIESEAVDAQPIPQTH